MASNSSPPGQGANNPPPKPWERAGNSSGPGPFKPSSAGSTSEVVEASGTAKPGEIVPAAGNASVNTNALGRPLPARPWQQQTYGNSYGNSYGTGYGNNYGGGYASGMNYGGIGGTYGGIGGTYGGGLYGNNMYRGGYSGLYGGAGMYGGGLGGQMGGYGMGIPGPYGEQDPNNPFGPPSSPPGFWISFLRVLNGVVNFFGRIAILIDQNTQAFHMFITALLQLFDRSGMLYGELARFVLRLLGVRTKPKNINHPPGRNGLPAQDNFQASQNQIQGPKSAPTGAWENVWGDSN